uniref:Ig-like domain-containing protein n=1 Tax=Cyprinus carpio carpio TaxID=630221 RepID=A0A8C1I4Z0_CYPCA
MSREDGDRIVLECQLNDYFPEKLTVQWLEGDKPVNAQINKKFQNTDKGEKKYTYISQLSISAPYEGKKYTCKLVNVISQQMCSTVIAPSSKQAEVYLLGPSHSDVRSGTSVILTCLVVGQSVRLFSIQWKVNGKLLNHDVDKQAPKEHNNGTQSRENIMRVSGSKWNNYDVFTCEVTHLEYFPITNRCNIPADPKRPTVRILRPSDGDLSGLQNTNLLCLITGFFPSDISVQWQLNGTQLDASQFTNSPDGKFSIRSHLDLQPSDWAPGEVYTCRVTHLADTLVLNISMKTGTLDFKLLKGTMHINCSVPCGAAGGSKSP